MPSIASRYGVPPTATWGSPSPFVARNREQMLRSSRGWTSSHCTDPTIVTARRHAASVGGSPPPRRAPFPGSNSASSPGPRPYRAADVPLRPRGPLPLAEGRDLPGVELVHLPRADAVLLDVRPHRRLQVTHDDRDLE